MDTLKKGKFNTTYVPPSAKELAEKKEFLTSSLTDITKHMAGLYKLFTTISLGMVEVSESMEKVEVGLPEELQTDLKELLARTESIRTLSTKLEGLGKNAIDPAKILAIGTQLTELDKRIKGIIEEQLKKEMTTVRELIKSATAHPVVSSASVKPPEPAPAKALEPAKGAPSKAGTQERTYVSTPTKVGTESTATTTKSVAESSPKAGPELTAQVEAVHTSIRSIEKKLNEVNETLEALNEAFLERSSPEELLKIQDTKFSETMKQHGVTLTSSVEGVVTRIEEYLERRLESNNRSLLAEFRKMLDGGSAPVEAPAGAEVEAAEPVVEAAEPEESEPVVVEPVVEDEPAAPVVAAVVDDVAAEEDKKATPEKTEKTEKKVTPEKVEPKKKAPPPKKNTRYIKKQ